MLTDALKYLQSLFTKTPAPEYAEDCGMEYLVVPENSKFICLDDYMEKPRRLTEACEFTTLESLSDYIDGWKNDTSVMFCDINSKSQMLAIFDYHKSPADPSWKGHRATLKALTTPEWATWAGAEKKRMSQREFTYFLEDNAEDIAKPDLAPLLSTIKDVKIGRTGGTQSKVSATHESLSANKEVNIESGLPDIIELGIRPWQHSPTYLVKARPFVHAEEGKQPEFSYHLINIERVKEQAFREAVKKVQEATKIKVYL